MKKGRKVVKKKKVAKKMKVVRKKKAVRLKVERQEMPRQYMCSETSGAMLLDSLGVRHGDGTPITPEDVLEICAGKKGVAPDPRSVGLEDVGACLDELIGEQITCGMEDLASIASLRKRVRESGHPVLVQVQPKPGAELHTVVVVGYSNGRVYYHEPAPGGRAGTPITVKAFDKQWRPAGRRVLVCRRKKNP